MYWEPRNWHLEQIQVASNTKALGEAEKSQTLISLNIDIASGNVWGNIICRPLTLNSIQESWVTAKSCLSHWLQNRSTQYIFNLGFVCWTRICWKSELVQGKNTFIWHHLNWSKTHPSFFIFPLFSNVKFCCFESHSSLENYLWFFLIKKEIQRVKGD